MGLRAKSSGRNSMFVSEQSLPEKMAQALKILRPGHSNSGNCKKKTSNSSRTSGAVVDADDVVYIAAVEPKKSSPGRQSSGNFQNNFGSSGNFPSQLHRGQSEWSAINEKKKVNGKNHPNLHCDVLVQVKDPTLKDIEQIRNLYKSMPNVSTIEDYSSRPSRSSRLFAHDDYDADLSSSNRSPTDSGYRSTSRHITEENPYALSDDSDIGISHKTTTVVHINGDPTPSSRILNPNDTANRRLISHGVNLPACDDCLLGYGILCEPSACPINERDIVAVLQGRRCKSLGHFIDISIVPRLVDLVYGALVTLTEHVKRLTCHSAKVTSDDVVTAIKLTFPLEIFCAATKAASQAAAMYAMSGTGGLKKSLSARAELKFPIGKIYRWLIDNLSNLPISETTPIYLTAALECALEELVRKLVDNDRIEIMSLTSFTEQMGKNHDMASFFAYYDHLNNVKLASLHCSEDELVSAVNGIREKMVEIAEGSMCSAKSRKRSMIKFSREATHCLQYHLTHRGNYRNALSVPLNDWVRLSFAFAEHRMSPTVDECDVQQAAHILLSFECPAPSVSFYRHGNVSDGCFEEAKMNFALSMISDNPATIQQASGFLPDGVNSMNQFGLGILSEAVVRGNTKSLDPLIQAKCPVNLGVPKSMANKRPCLLTEYVGWTPLTWAVGCHDHLAVDILISHGAELHNEDMIKESPIQAASQQSTIDMTTRLLHSGADPFRTSIIYDSSQASFRNVGCPSALALACIREDIQMIEILLKKLNDNSISSSVKDFLQESNNQNEMKMSKTDFEKLPLNTRLALSEAIYYAVETSRPQIACDLRRRIFGLSWNAYTWTRALQAAAEEKNKALIDAILADFVPKIVAEFNSDNIDFCLSVLFSLVKWECRRQNGDPTTASFTISRIWYHFSDSRRDKATKPIASLRSHKTLIDASFVNNKELSDVRFMVEDQVIYGHRIVLINASERFKQLLASPSGAVYICDISHDAFLGMMQFVYVGKFNGPLKVNQLFSLIDAADLYGLPAMKDEALRELGDILSPTNIVELYQFAIANNYTKLLERCEVFALDHFGALASGKKFSDLVLGANGSYDMCVALSSRLASAFEARQGEKKMKK